MDDHPIGPATSRPREWYRYSQNFLDTGVRRASGASLHNIRAGPRSYGGRYEISCSGCVKLWNAELITGLVEPFDYLDVERDTAFESFP
ncbi:hypothetical protein BH23CHL2_BH23CHL2_07860 [soil metagenome]